MTHTDQKRFKIAIIGLGYVGLPLAHAFSDKYPVVGFDISKQRIEELRSGYDRTLELSENQLKEAISNGLIFTDRLDDIEECTVYIVTVPTPIDATNKPDLTPLIRASRSVGKVLKRNDIVTTVYPGVTEEVCVPILEEESGLVFNQDFFCGYSPERINPGDKKNTIKNILKITSGSTPQIAKIVDDLYASVITAGTHLAPSIKVAEAAKVIENTQRDVNIALINELALIFDTMGIDTHAVLEAANTKWNFIKFTPGLVGGHCIGIDPYYLTYKAQELGYTPNLILGARQLNNGMSKYVAERTIKEMIRHNKKIKDADVLILGLTFKEECPDTRNSKVFELIDELADFGCKIDAFDPWVDPKELQDHQGFTLIENPFVGTKKYDAIVVAVAHNFFKEMPRENYDLISTEPPVIIDVKGVIEKPTWRL